MSNPQFWNERYNSPNYAYGEKPNEYFYQELKKIEPGNLLLPCEGEGRNAVAAATLGWQVTAFDQSTAGQKKALLLAQKNNVALSYKVGQLEDLNFKVDHFDAIGLIYAHLPQAEREKFHRGVSSLLKPGGYLILEGFHTNQLGRNSGGPQQLEMLFTEHMLRNDFSNLSIVNLKNLETVLDEGVYHKGRAQVIRMVAQKPAMG